MKRILLSLGLIAAVAGAAGSATMAYFSNSRVLGANTIATGKLIIDVNNGATTLPFGNISGLGPGDSVSPAQVEIKNTGSMNLGWFSYFGLGGNTELGDVIYIKDAKMEFLKTDGSSTWETLDQFITNGRGDGDAKNYYNSLADKSTDYHVITLANWNTANAMGVGGGVQEGALKPNNKYRFTFTLAMVPEATEAYQDKTLNLSYTVKATQLNQAALTALDTADSRVSIGSVSEILTWMNNQLIHQD